MERWRESSQKRANRHNYRNEVGAFPEKWRRPNPKRFHNQKVKRTQDEVLQFAWDEQSKSPSPQFLAKLAAVGYLPKVFVCLPVNQSNNLAGWFESVGAQRYPNMYVVVCLNKGDKSLSNVDPKYLSDPRFFVVWREKPQSMLPWFGRDANDLRAEILEQIASLFWERYHEQIYDEDVFMYTDVKIRHKTDWIAQCVHIMWETHAEVVGGVMDALPEHEPTWAECKATVSTNHSFGPVVFLLSLRMFFWALWRIFLRAYHDGALIRRNPEFAAGGQWHTEDNMGDTDSLIVTACVGVTWGAFKRVKARFGRFFPTHFRDSYEDFMLEWWLLLTGARVFVTGAWKVFHKHRANLGAMKLEMARSSRGACQMFVEDPSCPFGQRRALQVAAVFVAIGFALIVTLYGVISGHVFLIQFEIAFALMTWFTLGLVNVQKAGKWYAFFFFPFTIYFMWVFARNFVRKAMEGGGMAKDNKWLQRMWFPPIFFPFLMMSFEGGYEKECRETGFCSIAFSY